MPKKFIKRFLPDHTIVQDNKHLRIFGTLLHDPNLWHLNRDSIARAFIVGMFAAFMPIPFQMVLAAGLAIVAHSNLPISVVLVWITNPVTMPPIFYACYHLGAWLLNTPEQKFAFELSWDWLKNGLLHVWEPFLLGCVVAGLSSGMLGYAFVHIAWRLHVVWKWKNRHKNKLDNQGE